MSTISESVDVDVPIATAYDQWTQFETFAREIERHCAQPQQTGAHGELS